MKIMDKNLSRQEKMRGYCGLRCDRCEVYLADANGEEGEKDSIARDWSDRYGWNLTPADIRCSGCRDTGGEQFQFCGNCAVRRCAITKGISGCAECPQATCEKLADLFLLEPDVKVEHDRLRGCCGPQNGVPE